MSKIKKAKTISNSLSIENKVKIENLANALREIGIDTDIEWNAEWYCIDNKVHCGIEIATSIDTGEDYLSLNFTPDGRYIENCTKAPLR